MKLILHFAHLYIVPAETGLWARVSWVSLFLSEKKVRGQLVLVHGFLPGIREGFDG